MNYEEMSDFEINRAVAKNVLWNIRDCEEIDCNDKTGMCSWADGAKWHEFNPCNNPSDAWPIIIENKISITGLNPARSRGWEADAVCKMGLGCPTVEHENPLRAAMIVFLMMEDAKNAD